MTFDVDQIELRQILAVVRNNDERVIREFRLEGLEKVDLNLVSRLG
jgi:hypothetical protein